MLVAPVALEVVLEVEGLVAVFGLVKLLVEAVGFRTVVEDVAAPRFSASVSDFAAGDPWVPETARDVRLAAVESGFFFSSPEPPIDACDLCPALADVEPVALVAGFRTEDTGGRVGGLLNPPVVLVVEDVVGFAVEEVDADPRRFGATPPAGRFGRIFSFLTPLASFAGVSFSFSVCVSISGATPVLSSPDRMPTVDSAADSSWRGTSGASTSAMFTVFED